jgi:hypothetical protein
MAPTSFIVVPGKQEVIIVSTFHAPPPAVFEACIDPNALVQLRQALAERGLAFVDEKGEKTHVQEHQDALQLRTARHRR